jgi:hypothetical protein
MRDLKYAVRMLIEAPGFTAAAMILVAIGLAAGLLASYFVAGAMSALVVGVNSHDPLTFAATPLRTE